jgi:CheY-like chemotaxis protein/HPt (histidine-containing phosphotransfer) domain-containing protein
VTDTGIGIPEQRQESIFEGFTQVDGSTTRKYGGTGLGVTICKEIVGLMGGEMGLESEVGKGSTFWFTVDVGICGDLDEVTEEPDNEARELALTTTAMERANILVAEDYPTNQEVVRIHLTAQGHNVSFADHGREAVELCRQHKFDMIFMDVQMPEMDGLEATRRLRADVPGYADTPIVALTANGEIDTRLACLEAGMNDVVTKPVRRATLLAAVSAWLGQDEDPAASDDAQEATPASPATDRPGSEHPPLDYDEAVREFAGNSDLLDKVLARFIEQARSQLQLLNDAIDAGDVQTLQAEAHKIKGGASNLTANDLAEAARELDALCKAGDPDLDVCRQSIRSIADQFDRLTAFLATTADVQPAQEGHAE